MAGQRTVEEEIARAMEIGRDRAAVRVEVTRAALPGAPPPPGRPTDGFAVGGFDRSPSARPPSAYDEVDRARLENADGSPAGVRGTPAGTAPTAVVGDEFVPEEEETGAEWRDGATQGDHLMMAKAKRQQSRTPTRRSSLQNRPPRREPSPPAWRPLKPSTPAPAAWRRRRTCAPGRQHAPRRRRGARRSIVAGGQRAVAAQHVGAPAWRAPRRPPARRARRRTRAAGGSCSDAAARRTPPQAPPPARAATPPPARAATPPHVTGARRDAASRVADADAGTQAGRPVSPASAAVLPRRRRAREGVVTARCSPLAVRPAFLPSPLAVPARAAPITPGAPGGARR